MKAKSKYFDADFMGGLGPLTKEDEQTISNYIKTQKLMKAKRRIRKTSKQPLQKENAK